MPTQKKGLLPGGINYTYAMETLKETGMVRHLKVSTPHPFPEKLAVEFLTGLDEVLCLEELDPVIERELIYICGKYHLNTKIIGKLSGDTACAGENTRDSISNYIHTFLGLDTSKCTGTSKILRLCLYMKLFADLPGGNAFPDMSFFKPIGQNAVFIHTIRDKYHPVRFHYALCLRKRFDLILHRIQMIHWPKYKDHIKRIGSKP
mgnify:CR=1 FL=1